MNKKRAMRRYALDDAATGVTNPEERVQYYLDALLGKRPGLDLENNYRDRQTAARLRQTAELDELTDDLREREIERAQDTSRTGLLLQVCFLGAAECLAAILVMANIGLANPEKTTLGVMLGAGLIYLAQQCTERSKA